MKEGVRFQRLPYEDPAWCVEVRGSNGEYSAAQEFYVDPADLADLGRRLVTFPRDLHDEVRYEDGNRTGRHAYYLLLRAFLHDSLGHAALEFAADNRGNTPDHAQASFFILCEVAAINRLGERLQAWARHSDEPPDWDPRHP